MSGVTLQVQSFFAFCRASDLAKPGVLARKEGVQCAFPEKTLSFYPNETSSSLFQTQIGKKQVRAPWFVLFLFAFSPRERLGYRQRRDW
jgi:hypothetical protein